MTAKVTANATDVPGSRWTTHATPGAPANSGWTCVERPGRTGRTLGSARGGRRITGSWVSRYITCVTSTRQPAGTRGADGRRDLDAPPGACAITRLHQEQGVPLHAVSRPVSKAWKGWAWCQAALRIIAGRSPRQPTPAACGGDAYRGTGRWSVTAGQPLAAAAVPADRSCRPRGGSWCCGWPGRTQCWGFRRIKGELRKLGYQVSATSIRGVLRRHRVPPAPRRAGLSWQRFLRAQAGAVLACDFFSVDSVWVKQLYVMFFIELASRRVFLAGVILAPPFCTPQAFHPTQH